MTLLQLKNKVSIFIEGDRKLPSEIDKWNTLIGLAIEYISNRTIPFSLIGTSLLTQEPYRYIKDLRFIRKPVSVIADDSKVDIDEQLGNAVGYYISMMIAKDEGTKFKFNKLCDIEIDVYDYNNRVLLDELQEDGVL